MSTLPSTEANITPVTRRGFFKTASVSATAIASGIGWAAASGKTATPLSAIHEHVCGLHFFNGDINRQVIAHHYCSHFREDLRQCVIYDSDAPQARLVGIEYIISAKLFEALPADEKQLWHSHGYEVKSGQLTAPRVREAAEVELMKGLVGTYGKTWYTWPVDRDDQMPLGIPQLMMAFTADGQVNADLLAARDKAIGISSEEKRRSRAGIGAPAILPGADAWREGRAIQLQAKTVTSPTATQ